MLSIIPDLRLVKCRLRDDLTHHRRLHHTNHTISSTALSEIIHKDHIIKPYVDIDRKVPHAVFQEENEKSLWFANLLQKPWERTRVVLVLISKEGTGKGMVITDVIGEIIGQQCFLSESRKDNIFGTFNHWTICCVRAVDERQRRGGAAKTGQTRAFALSYEPGRPILLKPGRPILLLARSGCPIIKRAFWCRGPI